MFVLPTIILFLGVVVVPICMSAGYSVLDWDGLGEGTFIGAENYVRLFGDDAVGFGPAVVNSIILAVLSVGIQIPLAIFLAVLLSREPVGEGFFRTIYYIPVIVSSIVIAQLFKKIYNADYGMLNSLLTSIGLESWTNSWLSNADTALFAVFIPIVWQYIGQHMLLLYAAMKGVDKSIYEAAELDGATKLQTLFKVTLPMIKPVLRVCIVFAVVGSFKIFDLVYALTGGGPMHATDVPSTLMYDTIFLRHEYGLGSAMAIFIVIECVVTSLLIQSLMKTDDVD